MHSEAQLIQPDLVDVPALPPELFRAEEAQGTYTAERFRARRPEAFSVCIALLGSGLGINRIAQLLAVSDHTVLAVRDGSLSEVARARAEDSRACATTARRLLDRIRERVDDEEQMADEGIKDMTIALGILEEKSLLLGGEATQIVDVRHAAPISDLNSFVDAIIVEATPIETKQEPKEITA